MKVYLIFVGFVLLIMTTALFLIKDETKPRDYQIELKQDYYIIYDGNRVVGVIRYGNSLIDSVFLRDNQ